MNLAKLRKITINYECRGLLYRALDKCGDVLKEIHVEDTKRTLQVQVPANILYYISGLNLKALVKLRFNNVTFTLSRKTGNEPLFSRLQKMSIACPQRTLNIFFYLIPSCVDLPALAICNIESLERAIVTCPIPKFIDEHEKAALGATLINRLKDYPNVFQYMISFTNVEGSHQVQIILEKNGNTLQTQHDPKAAFNTFLDKMRKCYY